MALKHKIMLSIAGAALMMLLVAMVFGDNGYVELGRLRSQNEALRVRNEELVRSNLELHRRIERLETDEKYIEAIARQELGMIAEDELVVKFRRRPAASGGAGAGKATP